MNRQPFLKTQRNFSGLIGRQPYNEINEISGGCMHCGMCGGKLNFKKMGKNLKNISQDVGQTLSSRDAINTYKEIGDYGLEYGVPMGLNYVDPSGTSSKIYKNQMNQHYRY